MSVQDRRRPPFCYQTHEALDLIRARFEGAKRTTAIAVYVGLTEAANRAGGAAAREGGFRAARKELAEAVGISADTLDRYVSDLVEIGLVEVRRERVGSANVPNVWILREGVGAPPSRTGAATPSRTGAAVEQEPKKNPVEKDPYLTVQQVWLEQEALPRHRASYFQEESVRRACRKAIERYGADDVAQAIRNYATVLASPDHFFSYRWTLRDFLKRGLDRFVPELDPLRNFRRDRDTRGGPTADDFPDLDPLG